MQIFSADELIDPADGSELVEFEGNLTGGSGRRYPVINGIPRFVEASHYSSDFGIQWNKFPSTQLDSGNGTTLSEDRLRRCLNGYYDALVNKRVLEVGSGSGRFTELLAAQGAILHSFDSSLAVDANFNNNGRFENLLLAQADIYNCPFRKKTYDFVICLGVVQHTPDPEKTIKTLYEMVKPGGCLIFDHYLFKLRDILPPPIGIATNVYRPIMLRIPAGLRMGFTERLVKFWFPIHWKFRESLFLRRVLRRLSPVLFYWGNIELANERQYYDYALLDTHDSLTDRYKYHRTKAQVVDVLVSLGASDIKVAVAGNGLEAFCRSPS